MAIDLYTPLAQQVHYVRGCGIAGGKLVIVGTQAKPSLHVWLEASDELWHRIENTPQYTYPDDVVDALSTMVRPIMPLVHERQVFLTPNEAITIGLADSQSLWLSGVVNDEGTFKVPNAMLNDTETRERMANPMYPNQYWAAELNTLEYYDPDNAEHPAGLSFLIVPKGQPSLSDYYKAARVTDMGWNWAAALTHNELVEVAMQLDRNAPHSQPLGV